MVKVKAQGNTFDCEQGANLQVLLESDLYKGGSKVINYQGIGTCGTCAVQVAGESEVNRRDRAQIASSSFSYNRPTFSWSNS